jgi:hypothetical protein
VVRVADVGVWVGLGLVLALLGVRAWVVETGHAALGRTPVKVKVLTGACAVAVVVVAGAVAADGGVQLAGLVLDPAKAKALEDAREAAEDAPAPAAPGPPAPAPPAPAPGN